MLALALGAACAIGGSALLSRPADTRNVGERGIDASYSNIYPEDYVGPASCGECHEEKHATWETHSHSRMNREPTAATVKGDFSGARLSYGGNDWLFHESGGSYYMTCSRDGELVRRLRVTLVVGSRFYQFYIGLQEEGPEPTSHQSYRVEAKLPFGYSYLLGRWLPELYFDSYPPKENDYSNGRSFAQFVADDAPEHEWNTSCVRCHNTSPYVLRFKGKGWPKGFPDRDIGLDTRSAESRLVAWTEQDLPIHRNELVTLGISCESCHFGGREHVENRKPMSFVPRSPELTVRRRGEPHPVASDPDDPYVVNSICSQCHNARVERFADGSPQWNSAEAKDLARGACVDEIKCTDCHNPHRPEPPGGSPDRRAHVRACLGCHEKLASPGAALAHSGHEAGVGVNCLDCHMPRITQGLETVVRSHRISSPGDPAMLAAGHPNACNVCHLDKSLNWTIDELRTGWGVELEPGRSWAKRYGGSLNRPVGLAWLRSENPVTRIIAADAYSRSPHGARHVGTILESLINDYAVNRLFGLVSIERIIGRRLSDQEYDLLADPETRLKQYRELRARAMRGRLLAEPEVPTRRTRSSMISTTAGGAAPPAREQ